MDQRYCFPQPETHVPYCVFTHTPLLDRALAAYNIRRCTPTGVGPSAITHVCSVDSHILTGMRACKVIIKNGGCSGENPILADRLVLDDTVTTGTSNVSMDQYFLPKLKIPNNVAEIITIVPQNATPHFKALWTVLVNGIRDFVEVISLRPCNLSEVLKDPSLAARLDFFKFVIEIMTLSLEFHGINQPQFETASLLGSLAAAARDTMLSALGSSRPEVDPRFFGAQVLYRGKDVVRTTTPHVDKSLRSIYSGAIRPGDEIYLSGKEENMDSQQTTDANVSPLRVFPKCNVGGPRQLSFYNKGAFSKRMNVSYISTREYPEQQETTPQRGTAINLGGVSGTVKQESTA